MRVRPAEVVDYPRMVEMGAHFIAETMYRDHAFYDPAQVETAFGSLLQHHSVVSLVAEENGVLVGMVAGMIQPHMLYGEITATELFWWAEPSARPTGLKLLKAFEELARERGAKKVLMIAPSARVEKLYQRLGYRHHEAVYEKSLEAINGRD
jgi:GNAT superfamily N-acetyltransferase